MIFFSLKISGKLFRNFLENFGKCFLEILGIKNSSLGIRLGDQLGLGRVKVQLVLEVRVQGFRVRTKGKVEFGLGCQDLVKK